MRKLEIFGNLLIVQLVIDHRHSVCYKETFSLVIVYDDLLLM